jgi:nitrate/TMAO reductase-like tetraheme cytochrome c subunit
MSIRNRIRDFARPAYYLGQNPISLLGAVLTTSTALTMIAFWFYDVALPGPPHPYIGILIYLILPGIFLLGLMLIPIGMLRQRIKLRKLKSLPIDYPAIDLKIPLVRRGFLLVSVATVLNLAIIGTASYRGVSYMDSTQFCGQTCHTVMEPEYIAYQNSPHSRVNCVECHIGPGASWFVHSKISGVRQVFAVTFHTYSKPIPSPVKYLRPARETCEQCHWPQRFTGDKFEVHTRYQDDEKNSPLTTVLLVKVGGHSWQGAVGIHGRHLDEGSRIRYISTDRERQVIPVVYYVDDSGKTIEFVSTDSKASKAQLEAGEHRSMDCVDCHNRPTHTFEMPDPAVDKVMGQGRIDISLPFIKKKAVEVLKVNYSDRDTAQKQIIASINDFYRTNYPQIYQTKQSAVQQSAEQIAAIYMRNIFPAMNVTWGVHPNNLGHNELGHSDFPGCFRCHDGNHTSADGQTITNDCNACHTLLAMDEANPKVLTDLGIK